MTTKGPFRKQIIVLMNGNNIIKFIKKSSYHILSINKALRNIKSDVLVDFICSDPLGIMVVTCKVTSSSDLQVIENYIKNVNCINIIGIDIPRLLQSKSYLKIIGIYCMTCQTISHWKMLKILSNKIKSLTMLCSYLNHMLSKYPQS